ncbi:conserved membrane hypothetical protein [Candidatus Methylobacter favarea]|uniref:Yip1 domain-containing protein n=1 Tax=Candidatus Methylobacter favarea TaxID=2707345 RepID=A0A8S0XL18_9GAMM|nr:hypothetical protein [Candidatus Methylobacter favarea]CAA9892492.1 conserved membrane hypothetical protein [Candidatus Methylobacter favarea]
MFEIIKLLFDICLFRRGPQDLPHSSWLLRLLIAMYVIIRFLMLSIGTQWLNALLQVGVEVLLVVGFSWSMLYVVQQLQRFNQATCALLGTDAIISFFALPSIASMEIGRGGWLAFMVVLGLIIWHWAVTGHIIRHALGQKLVFSLGLAFLYILGSYRVMVLLFPEIAGTE